MKKVKNIFFAVIILLFAGIYSYGVWPVKLYDENIDSTLYENVGEMVDGSEIAQSFVCKDDGLDSIELKVSNLGQECEAVYGWSLTESDTQKTVAEGELEASQIDNAKNSILEFSKLENSKDQEYTLSISTKEIKSEHGITFMMTERNEKEESTLVIDGTQSDRTLVLTEQVKHFNLETFIVLLGLIAYLVLFMRFLIGLFK